MKNNDLELMDMFRKERNQELTTINSNIIEEGREKKTVSRSNKKNPFYNKIFIDSRLDEVEKELELQKIFLNKYNNLRDWIDGFSNDDLIRFFSQKSKESGKEYFSSSEVKDRSIFKR